MALALFLVSAGLVLGGRVGFHFFPSPEADVVIGNVVMAPGTPRRDTAAMVQELSDAADRAVAELTGSDIGLIAMSFGSVGRSGGRQFSRIARRSIWRSDGGTGPLGRAPGKDGRVHRGVERRDPGAAECRERQSQHPRRRPPGPRDRHPPARRLGRPAQGRGHGGQDPAPALSRHKHHRRRSPLRQAGADPGGHAARPGARLHDGERRGAGEERVPGRHRPALRARRRGGRDQGALPAPQRRQRLVPQPLPARARRHRSAAQRSRHPAPGARLLPPPPRGRGARSRGHRRNRRNGRQPRRPAPGDRPKAGWPISRTVSA